MFGRRKLGRHDEEQDDISQRLKQLEAKNADLELTIKQMQGRISSPIPKAEGFIQTPAPVKVEAPAPRILTCSACRQQFSTALRKQASIRDSPVDVSDTYPAHAVSPKRDRFWYIVCGIDCAAKLDEALSHTIKSQPLYAYGDSRYSKMPRER